MKMIVENKVKKVFLENKKKKKKNLGYTVQNEL